MLNEAPLFRHVLGRPHTKTSKSSIYQNLKHELILQSTGVLFSRNEQYRRSSSQRSHEAINRLHRPASQTRKSPLTAADGSSRLLVIAVVNNYTNDLINFRSFEVDSRYIAGAVVTSCGASSLERAWSLANPTIHEILWVIPRLRVWMVECCEM